MMTQTTLPEAASGVQPRRLGRSVAAVLAGFFAVALLSLAADQILHMLGVYPPWGVPMYKPGLNLLALSYRCVFTVLGGYITARIAPRNPMRHVLALGILGFIMGAAGIVVALTRPDLGPTWYPIALVLTSVPCVWLGGILHKR